MERFLSNAFNYTSKGEIEFGVSYLEKKDSFEFYVKDTGIGIALEHFEEVFEPFHQLNPIINGVGIGLTICKAHCSLIKTKIKLDSELNKGSTFSFRIKNKS